MTAPVHDITTLTARQRLAAADLVESLAAADLETPSLVNGWTTKDVLAHLVDGTQRSLPRFARAALRHGGTAGANTALVHRSSPPAPDRATATTKAEPVPTPRPPWTRTVLVHRPRCGRAVGTGTQAGLPRHRAQRSRPRRGPRSGAGRDPLGVLTRDVVDGVSVR